MERGKGDQRWRLLRTQPAEFRWFIVLSRNLRGGVGFGPISDQYGLIVRASHRQGGVWNPLGIQGPGFRYTSNSATAASTKATKKLMEQFWLQSRA